MADTPEIVSVPELEDTPKPITGRDWRKEVGGVGFDKAQNRRKFYLERAKFKLKSTELRVRTQQDLDSIFDDPAKRGFSTYDDVKKAPVFTVVADHRTSLHTVLMKVFQSIMLDADALKLDREIALTQYYLSHHETDARGRKINVDLIRDGEKIEVRDGKLTITGSNGVKRIDNVFLRRPSGELIEGEGDTIP